MIPTEVALGDDKTVVTVASSSSIKAPNKTERPSFMSILLSTSNYDQSGKLTAMASAQMSDEAMDVLTSTASLAEQAKSLFEEG